jgi:DinB superfamily
MANGETIHMSEGSGRLQLSTEEKSKAANYLEITRDGLLQTLDGLSDRQLALKLSPDRWSIAEVVEHLVIFETFVHGLLHAIKEISTASIEYVDTNLDRFVLTVVPDRSKRLVTPPPGEPAGRWNPSETVSRFVEARTKTLELLDSNTSLRGHVVPNPLYQSGPWDGHQWVLAVAAHTARHTEQAEEVKALVLASS